MKIAESDFSNHIVKSTQKELGNIFFFNHIAVIEFNEGVHIDINNSNEIFEELINFFGNSRPFGIVANRINSYSINLLDADLFKKKISNLCHYAVVGHNRASKMNAEIENSFCNFNKINYDCIHEAMTHTYGKVKKDILLSLH
ncbi:hypothetical protein Q4Q35_14340 [Flavivirga aquimarina]|uniref:Uncharacterized protein n=1 Tax=Flavivirga aquimarina TaxID=2027862 RepID=A0ABT8WCX4_9FLAO|nr:hypothetical protein [Flavivirga aquimarina]MDO5970983.1 hypothetical protein [Flavivirga aquimarina]